ISIFPWLKYLPHTKKFKELLKGSEIRDSITRKFFEEHIQTFNPEKLRDLTDNLLYLSQNKEMWQDAGFEKVTQLQLESIINSIFVAGIETSLSTLRWMLIYLFHNPKIQNKIYNELYTNLGPKHQITTEDMRSLPYTQAVLHETNRYASTLPLSIPHKTTVDTSVAGLSVPKGTQVLFNLYSMHHDPTHWDEPEKFKPERWLNPDGNLKKEKVSHYLPFSTGTRVCLGERLAKMQMFLIVTKLFLTFEVELAPGEKVPDMKEGNIGITLEPRDDFKVILKPRKH
ncbi:steroid 17-alpha-hydroxylase/17,20 lyase-like, partial [Clytia hemisphaerica]|uniref:steroid 17-alpha-hydroxylase/17,20 lyase-like n=1 Tax=Clytia hemisphaerica TaxID=252671 RepID=UPI0034D4F5C1